MSAVVSMRVFTGANAGTESTAQVGLDLISADNAENGPSNRDDNEVAPGANSFEKWIRLRVDDADDKTLSGFWIERTGDLPDGVVVKLGTTDTPATPTASESTVATETMHAGRRYWFDVAEYAADGDHTKYLVLQEQVAADADAADIETQAFEWGWSAV